MTGCATSISGCFFYFNIMTKKEVWKDIPNYEGYYQASNLGRVRSLDRNVLINNKFNRFYKGKILKFDIDSGGYKIIKLSINRRRKFLKFSQLVAMAFLGHIPDGHKLVVDHINGNKLDDRVENLRVVTHRSNISTCFRSDEESLSSKYVGVSYSAINNKWRSSITYEGVLSSIGFYNNELDASNAYQNALSKINDGTFNHDEYKPKFYSKYKGVTYDKKRSKWRAQITVNGKQKHLGRFNTEIEAHHAYQKAI